MSRRGKLVFIAVPMAAALSLIALAVWRHYTAEPSLAELHDQHPWAQTADGFEREDHWLTVTDVKFSRKGRVTILGSVWPKREPPDRPGMVAGYSPGGRTWTPEFLEVEPTERIEIEYRFFEYSLAEPEPVEGYYCIELAYGGVNHVFVNFLTGDWKAD